MVQQCPRCSAIMADDAMFCGRCGYRFEKEATTTDYKTAYEDAIHSKNYGKAFWICEIRRKSLCGHRPRRFSEYNNEEDMITVYQTEYDICMEREKYNKAAELSKVMMNQMVAYHYIYIESANIKRDAAKIFSSCEVIREYRWNHKSLDLCEYCNIDAIFRIFASEREVMIASGQADEVSEHAEIVEIEINAFKALRKQHIKNKILGWAAILAILAVSGGCSDSSSDIGNDEEEDD